MVRNNTKTFRFLKYSQSGQSVVEYILLVAVLISFVFLVFSSQRFKNLFGTDSEFSRSFANRLSCQYRFASSTMVNNCTNINRNYQGRIHPSYFPTGGQTRFFGPRSPYPGN